MAKKKSKSEENVDELWEGVGESDFLEEKNVEDVDIGEYDKKNMLSFASNVNLFRLLIRLSDSLKPVERRILYALYKLNIRPGTKAKSSIIVSNTMTFHAHGDAAIYKAMVGMAQSWKKQVPLVKGKGNFGNRASEMYAHYRYTEAGMSKYAWECFFEDYDPDCVEMIFNNGCGMDEPMALPSKFPNVLVNGGMGFAFGNAFEIPPYNINDIIENTKKVLADPECPNIYMVPDYPTDCDIVDDGTVIQSIIDTGMGTIKLRGRIEIEETPHNWILWIRSIPWMTNLDNILDRIHDLAKSGALSIVDIRRADKRVKLADKSVETRLATGIVISKAHDPVSVMEKLYSLTDLEKSRAVNFRVVSENLTIDSLNLRQLIQAWIDERRSYKRRLYNKRLTKISARIEFLEILLYLTKSTNIDKVIAIIKKSNTEEIAKELMKIVSMSSYQAYRIAEMKLGAFSKDAVARYKEELEKLRVDKIDVEKIIVSEKKVDQIISEELEDLRKYAIPRRTHVISPSNGKQIPDTNHFIVTSNEGYIKKLGDNGKSQVALGAFKTGDYPTSITKANNLDSLIFMDSFGRYSTISTHEIENNEASQYGHQAFGLLKLAGTIVSVEHMLNDADLKMLAKLGEPYLITITRNGYIKRTSLKEYLGIRNTRNIRCMKIRDDDSMIYSKIILGNAKLLIYTQNGQYTYINAESIPEQSKDAMGVIAVKIDSDDAVVGCTVIGKDDMYVGIVTDKGLVKKIEISSFGDPSAKRHINQSYLASLEASDKVNIALGLREDSGLGVYTRAGYYPIDDVPEMTRKAKGKKLVPIPLGINIINVKEITK